MNHWTVYLRKSFVFVILLASVSSFAIGRVRDAQLEKKQTVLKARDTYYNLRRSGLIEFRSNIQPNWELLLAGVDKKASALSLLNGLHFSASIDSESRFRLEHRFDVAPSNQKTADGLARIVKGMDEAVSQFFVTWSLFMLTSPFPVADSEYEVKETAGEYRFLHKEGASDVETITNKDFMVLEIHVTARDFSASLKPALERTKQGFILKGFAASYVAQSGQRTTSVNTRVEYEELNGLQLLHKVKVDTVYDGAPGQMEWLFTDYQVKVR
jgi:hypothetical protein